MKEILKKIKADTILSKLLFNGLDILALNSHSANGSVWLTHTRTAVCRGLEI